MTDLRSARWLSGLLLFAWLGCGDGSPAEATRAKLDPDEVLPAGDGTNTLLAGPNAFTRPLDNLSADDERSFFTGNSFFNQSWVTAPASTTARDGLGPTFNARSCSGCHFKDGPGQPFAEDGTGLGLLLRLSVEGEGPHGEPVGAALYGGQLEDQSIADVPAEGRVVIEHASIKGKYDDGEPYTLSAPSYTIEDLAFGDLPDDIRISPRLAPKMIGLGLLQAIPEARLRELADPDDEDDDGISGKLQRVIDAASGERVVGRFGWKAEQPTVAQQSAGALQGDMGITSSLFPQQECPAGQQACGDAETGGDPEIEDATFAKLALYAQSVAVPARRSADADEVLRGKQLFTDNGCAGCHVARHETGEAEIDALADQVIWPYTDLLLHDMGDALSDERPSFAAEGAEWRTPPLWGLGLVHEVNGPLALLHDGRAGSVAEAILWHGGEGETAMEAFRSLAREDRDALVHFVESL